MASLPLVVGSEIRTVPTTTAIMLSPRSPSRHIGSPVLKLRGFA
jgi:hypothetical protein